MPDSNSNNSTPPPPNWLMRELESKADEKLMERELDNVKKISLEAKNIALAAKKKAEGQGASGWIQ